MWWRAPGGRCVLAVLLTYAAIFIAVGVFGWDRTWSAIGVRLMPLPFGDIRAITGATVTIDRGLDPMIDNVGDPWRRPANYPRIWMATAHALRLTPDTSVAVGIALFAAFIGSLLVIAPLVATASDAVVIYLAAVSPAALLGVERGKIDFIVLLVVCAAVMVRRPWPRVGLLAAATLLKIFPVFAIPAVAMADRRARLAAVLALSGLAVWAYSIRADLQVIRLTMPLDARGAHGLPALQLAISHGLHGRARLSAVLGSILAGASALVGSVAGLTMAARASRIAGVVDPVQDRRVMGLLIAAAIYLGSFFAGPNYDYRLVFLVLALPFLNAVRRNGAGAVSMVAAGGVVAVLIAMSEVPLTSAFGHAGTAVNDLSKVGLVGLLSWAAVLALVHPATTGIAARDPRVR